MNAAKPPALPVLSTQTLLQETHAWTAMLPEDRRRRAIRALHGNDTDELLSVWRASVSHLSRSGVRTSVRTVETYEIAIRQLSRHAEEGRLNMVRPGPHEAQNLIAHLLEQGASPATVQVKVAAWKSLWRALRWAGVEGKDPWDDVRVPHDPTPGLVKNPPYQRQEIEALLKLPAEQHGAARLLTLLTSHAGLRISEALALEHSDLDLNNRRARVSGKGRKVRLIALSARTCEEIRRYAGSKQSAPRRKHPSVPDTRVFPFGHPTTASDHMERACLAAGVQWRGFHAGRKHAGTRLLSQVRDFGRVAAHLGHASVDTTRKGYAQLAVDDLSDEVAQW